MHLPCVMTNVNMNERHLSAHLPLRVESQWRNGYRFSVMMHLKSAEDNINKWRIHQIGPPVEKCILQSGGIGPEQLLVPTDKAFHMYKRKPFHKIAEGLNTMIYGQRTN